MFPRVNGNLLVVFRTELLLTGTNTEETFLVCQNVTFPVQAAIFYYNKTGLWSYSDSPKIFFNNPVAILHCTRQTHILAEKVFFCIYVLSFKSFIRGRGPKTSVLSPHASKTEVNLIFSTSEMCRNTVSGQSLAYKKIVSALNSFMILILRKLLKLVHDTTWISSWYYSTRISSW